MSEVKTDKISSVSTNGDITLDPDGTGIVNTASHVRITGGDDCDIEFQSGSARRKFVGGDVNNLEFGTYSSSNTSRDVHATLESNGDFHVGKTTGSINTAGLSLRGSSDVAQFVRSGDTALEVGRLSTDGDIVGFYRSTVLQGAIGANGNNRLYIVSGDTGLDFERNTDAIRPCSGSGGARDNVIDLGRPDVRFDDIYATNGSIQTSDQNEKNTIADSDLGLDFINRLSPKSYIFNNKTRTHYGMIAQDVETVLTDIGKTSTDFAGFIKSDVSDAQDGSAYKYGLRYTEFVSPLIQAVKDLKTQLDAEKAKVSALEARVTALENA